jgi:hypothetical protein
MDENLDKLYSPSKWNIRMPPQEIVNEHGRIIKQSK